MGRENDKYSLDDFDDLDLDLDDLDDLDDFEEDEEYNEYEDITNDRLVSDDTTLESKIVRNEENENKMEDTDEILAFENKKENKEKDERIIIPKSEKDDRIIPKKEENNSNLKKYGIIGIGAVVVVLIIVLLLGSCNNKYTVSFDTNGGTDIREQKVKKNGQVTKPQDPIRKGYKFVGWYLGEEKYDFSASVTSNIELEARWQSGNSADVKGVTLDQTKITIEPGNTFLLVAIIEPEDALDQTVEWSSSDEDIATVDSNGNVTAIKNGTAKIMVTTTSGGYTAICNVTVSSDVVSVTDFSLDRNELSLDVGEETTIRALIEPNNATNKGVTWKSSDTSVAKVINGRVIAVGEGRATITAKTKDGDFEETVEVTVKRVDLEDIELVPSHITIYVGETRELDVKYSPSNATNKSVTWKSDDTSLVKVDANGNITALKTGTANITATSEEGKKTSSTEVTVKEITKIAISQENLTDLYEKDSVQLVYSVNPKDAPTSIIKWKSSDTDVVTVSSKGVITCVKEGEATITAYTSTGVESSVDIKVNKPIEVKTLEITNEENLKELFVGEGISVETIVNNDATNKKLTYSSSNAKVATIDSNGDIKAVGEGTTTITVQSVSNPDKKVSVSVTVKKTTITITGNKGEIKNGEEITIRNNRILSYPIKLTSNNPGVQFTYTKRSSQLYIADSSNPSVILKNIKPGESGVDLVISTVFPVDKSEEKQSVTIVNPNGDNFTINFVYSE